MKSFPSCWNKTLTQLGFRRKVRKYKARKDYGRRSLFESLETRQMLATDIVPSAFSVPQGSTTFQVQYNITGDTAAAPFDISIYRSLNGSTPLGAPLVTTEVTDPLKLAVGTGHTVPVPTTFSDPVVDDYYLVAVVDANNDVTETAPSGENNNRRLFAGGIFQANDGVHVHLASANDTVNVNLETNGSYTFTAGALTYNTATPGSALRIRTHGGSDNITVDSDITLPAFIFGGDKVDTIHGGGGNDTIDGGDYGDFLYGHEGNDTISGGNEWDTISGGFGNDILGGGAGFDTIHGDEDDDTIDGGDYGDALYGDGGADIIYGGGGGDSIVGGVGNDLLFGGLDSDFLQGGDNDDILYGEAANDTLYGQTGNDILIQGAGTGTLQWQTGVTGVPDALTVRTKADENEALGSVDFKIDDLSLREALAVAAAQAPADKIEFAPTVYSTPDATILLGDTDGDGTSDVTGTQLVINSQVTIDGPGADLLTLSGGEQTRVFSISASSTLTGLSIQKGVPTSGAGGVSTIRPANCRSTPAGS